MSECQQKMSQRLCILRAHGSQTLFCNICMYFNVEKKHHSKAVQFESWRGSQQPCFFCRPFENRIRCLHASAEAMVGFSSVGHRRSGRFESKMTFLQHWLENWLAPELRHRLICAGMRPKCRITFVMLIVSNVWWHHEGQCIIQK